MNITYVLDGKHMQVHNNLSKDGFNSILTLLHHVWSYKQYTVNPISDIVEADIIHQNKIDSDCVRKVTLTEQFLTEHGV